MRLPKTTKRLSCWNRALIIAHAFIATLVLASCASAEFTPDCKDMSGHPQASSIDDLIEQSDFIGLYTARLASEGEFEESKNSPSRLKVYNFKLVLSTLISGKAPRTITLQGTQPAHVIPDTYFFIKDRHKEMVETDSLILGLAYQVEASDGVCVYMPQFIVGYNYLIFSGANSGAAYEPILSTRYDPFYRAVTSRVWNKN